MLLTSHHHHSLPSPPPGNPTLHPQPIQSLGPSSKDFTVLRAIGTHACTHRHRVRGHTLLRHTRCLLNLPVFCKLEPLEGSRVSLGVNLLLVWTVLLWCVGQTPSFPPFRIYRSLSLSYQVLPFLSFSHFFSFCFKFKPTTASLLRLWSELEIDRYAISGYKL